MYPGVKVPVFDVAGSGDTFLSALVYHYLNTGVMESSIPFANKAMLLLLYPIQEHVLTEDDVNGLCN